MQIQSGQTVPLTKHQKTDSASLMNMSMKLMNENSMSAVNTDTKQMMMNTSRAVAYPTYTTSHSQVTYHWKVAMQRQILLSIHESRKKLNFYWRSGFPQVTPSNLSMHKHHTDKSHTSHWEGTMQRQILLSTQEARKKVNFYCRSGFPQVPPITTSSLILRCESQH